MYTALIVDDELNNIELIKLFITSFCTEISIIGNAQSIEEVIAFLEHSTPQIIFLDIKLNEKLSFQIVDQIQALGIRIIFVTAYGKDVITKANISDVEFVQKPIDIDELIEACNKTITQINSK